MSSDDTFRVRVISNRRDERAKTAAVDAATAGSTSNRFTKQYFPNGTPYPEVGWG